MKKLLLIIYNKVLERLMGFGLIRTKTFIVNSKNIVFHDLGNNNLLKGIGINGFESHENETIKLIKKYNWEVDNFFDIGSNIGHYAVIASLYLENVDVVAVEPFPLNAEYIDKLKVNNNLSFSLVKKAVDSTTGETKDFYFPISKNSSKLPASGTLINSFKGSGGVYNDLPFNVVQVETITLDDLTKDNKGSFLIKIMINDKDKNDVFNLMSEHGYNGFLITNAGLVRESRPLTMPRPNRSDRTLWRNHFFSKKPIDEIEKFSTDNYGYWI
jgi:FkbM family methyltransferase